MGHSLQHDLKALRMIYSRIVDTAVLTEGEDWQCATPWVEAVGAGST